MNNMSIYKGIAKKKLTRHIHKSSHYRDHTGRQKSVYYCISVHYQYNLIGLGTGLNNLIMNYSDDSPFGKGQYIYTAANQYISTLPQIVIANHSNYHNMLPIINDDLTETSECMEGQMMRLDRNLRRFSHKHTFWKLSNVVRDELLISILTPQTIDQTSLFCFLPTEINVLICTHIDEIPLFEYK